MRLKNYYVSGEQARSALRAVSTCCSSCRVRALCLPGGQGPELAETFDGLVAARRRVKRGETLFEAGQRFGALHPIRSGFFKTSVAAREDREQITGFFMAGEVLGMGGIGTGRYNGASTALEDSEVCVVPFSLFEAASHEAPALQRSLRMRLGREIVRSHGLMMLLGSMRAEERLAAFLLDLAERHVERGYARLDFQLRMTREELGSFLGLKLETVSRLFSRLQQDGLVELQHKRVRILDSAGLEQLVAGARPLSPACRR